MRLLTWNGASQISLTRDFSDGENIPPYAILSHTWGDDSQEVTFADIEKHQGQEKIGYRKIVFCADRAKSDGYQHCWVDTCCINKNNQSELSEAITSMFRWYQNAAKCYVYLSDVSTRKYSENNTVQSAWQSSFRSSRWFTRGWTLQELLAPRVVEFYSYEGDLLGTKETLAPQIHEITTIPLAALHGTRLSQFPIDERIRWTVRRNTKKKEDQAYCLLGIFEVFIPFLYGEGDYALYRLQKEINERYGADIAAKLGADQQARSLGLCLHSAPVIEPSSFVGRHYQIDAVHHILQPNQVSTEQRRAVLGGMGGIGKTQLALAYARQHQTSYTSVLWLNATSEATLYASFRTTAQALFSADQLVKLTHEQMLSHVHRWLSWPDNTRWLLIFDNHDEPEQFDLDTFCPSIGHGSVIITTRMPDMVTGHVIRIQPLQDVGQSLAILHNRSGRQEVLQDIGARRLAQRLEGLPLALVTAGAYLRKSTLTFQQYLDAYEQRWQIDPRRPPRLQDYQDRTLYTTWDLSYTRLQAEDPEASQMLGLIAYFDHQELWYALFRAGLSDQLPAWLQSCLDSQIAFESVMGRLVEYSLVEVQHTSQSYSMHSCVHDWTLGSLNREIDSGLYWYTFDCIRASIDSSDWEALGQVKYGRISPHAVRLTHPRFTACDAAEVGLSSRLDQARWIARILHDQIQLSAAEQMYLRVLVVQEKALGPGHASILNTVDSLGILYRAQGKLEQAEQMYLRALAGREKALGPDHTSTLSTINNLSILYHDQGKLEQAEQMFLRALAGYENALGPDHTLTLGTINNLGSLYRAQGKLEQAEQMYKRALAGREKALGPNHVSTLNSKHCLANLYIRRGQFSQAESMYQQLLPRYEAVLGDDHSSTMLLVNNYGMLYEEQSRLNEAEHMYRRALVGYQKRLGHEHPSTRRAANDLSRTLSLLRQNGGGGSNGQT